MKAFAALGRFDETQPFAPWLKRIAINAEVDSLRSEPLGGSGRRGLARRLPAASREAARH